MRNGLYAVVLTQGSAPSVLRVGWFRHTEGDDWRVWWTTPHRQNSKGTPSELWVTGPDTRPDWEWGPLLEADATRLHFVPLARLDPTKWTRVAPQPTAFERP